jgi:FlaA1/EpsC-like NDP-sugar epimerase
LKFQLSSLPKAAKHLLMVASDVLVLPLALWSAVALRLGEWRIDPAPHWIFFVLTVVISLPIFLRMGLYRAVIRYLETRAFLAMVQASLLAASLFALLVVVLDPPGLPWSALVIYAILSSGYVGATRLLARQWLRQESVRPDRKPVLVYGAGSAGRQLVQALRQLSGYQPVALVDDNPDLQGRTILGLQVYPSLDMRTLVRRLDVHMVILAIPSMGARPRADLLRQLESLAVEVRLVPGMADLMNRPVESADIREVSPEDLLGRDPISLDQAGLRGLLHDRVIMVTGAGGSIGSELCRQIAAFAPRQLVCFDISEFSLYALREEFVGRWPELDIVCAVGDVKFRERVTAVMRAYQPTAVFHAAAYKHVPMMEEVNAWEALRNNTWGTWVVGRSAIDCGVENFVLVSTDKAVNPTNVMGATKRLAEMVCQSLHAQASTCFEVVRFGNVLGSSGSVIPKFRDQIVKGGPITVTHPDIVRYFMSIPEAAQLVLQAACMGRGGEVFVLDMGEPVRIVDLAQKMIRLSGRSEQDIGIEFTGLRPGEKLYEELLADSEFTRATHHPKIRIARVAESSPAWSENLVAWVEANPVLGDEEVRQAIAALLPEYQPWAST